MSASGSVPPAFVQHCSFRRHIGLKTLNPDHCHERFPMFSTLKPPHHPRHLSLSPGELITLTVTQPTTLHLQSGALWVTQSGDDRDHFLKAGRSMLLAPHRVTVMQAEGLLVRGSLVSGDEHTPKRVHLKVLHKLWQAGPQISN
jgi:hypothetical protein